MKQLLCKTIIIFTCIFGLSSTTIIPTYAADETKSGTSSGSSTVDCSKVPDAVKRAAGCSSTGSDNLPEIITNILTAIIAIGGIVAAIYIVIGGYNYMTSSGDASKVEKAKKTVIYAAIGLAVCALAFIIVNFVLTNILKQTPQ